MFTKMQQQFPRYEDCVKDIFMVLRNLVGVCTKRGLHNYVLVCKSYTDPTPILISDSIYLYIPNMGVYFPDAFKLLSEYGITFSVNESLVKNDVIYYIHIVTTQTKPDALIVRYSHD